MKKLICSVLLVVSTHLWANDISDLSTSSPSETLKSCRNISFDVRSGKWELHADCKAKNGAVYRNSVMLRGIVNHNGNLTFEKDMVGNNYEYSCKNAFVDSEGVMAAVCRDGSGQYKWTSIDLSVVMMNYNGTIVYKNDLDQFLNISKTCDSFSVERASVYALCKASNGGRYGSWVRLRGVNSYNGILTVEKDSRKLSRIHMDCKDLSVNSKAVLGGRCRNSAAGYVESSIQLDQFISNYNGTLVFLLND